MIVEDDWELAHRKLSGLHEEGTQEVQYANWLKQKGFECKQGEEKSTTAKYLHSSTHEDFEDELNREEVKTMSCIETILKINFCSSSCYDYYIN